MLSCTHHPSLILLATKIIYCCFPVHITLLLFYWQQKSSIVAFLYTSPFSYIIGNKNQLMLLSLTHHPSFILLATEISYYCFPVHITLLLFYWQQKLSITAILYTSPFSYFIGNKNHLLWLSCTHHPSIILLATQISYCCYL